MRPLRLLLASAVVAATALGTTTARAAAEPVTLTDVGILASDGVELVGDVHLPQAKGRYPAVVDMEPYGRSSDTSYLDEGYAHVNIDVRGSGKSGGALCLLCDREQQDAYDVVEWVAKQPWSNGKVVLKGYSYSAITALLGAAKQPPHLSAVIAGHPPTDPYRDVLWHHGLFMQGFVGQWFAGQTATQGVGLGVQPQYLDRKDQLFAVETRLTMLDGPLYDERSVLTKADKIKVPVYMTSGWNDMYSRGDLQLLDKLTVPKRLVMDASTHHGTGQAGHVGAPYSDAPLGLDPSLNTPFPAGEVERWMDRFVKGEKNGAEKLPALRYVDLGDRSWHDAPSWRSVQKRLTTYQLSGKKSGTAVGSPNDGSLVAGTPTGRDSYQDSYVYDPANGSSVPMDKEGPDGFAPYLALDPSVDHPHGLTYTSAPLKAPLKLAGPSELEVSVVTEANDMAYVARLVDVAPDGTAKLVTQAWLRASMREVDPKRSRPGAPYLPDRRQLPVVPGETMKLRMDLWDTAWTVPAGHRLRVLLGSSDTPNHEPLATPGRNLVFHDAKHPAKLKLGTR
ncbi:MAG: hydrolase, CocE/NonD family [Frankiales bacterium]|nr:hydrolase, CocE/NonD family [Frankiales bacterium]